MEQLGHQQDPYRHGLSGPPMSICPWRKHFLLEPLIKELHLLKTLWVKGCFLNVVTIVAMMWQQHVRDNCDSDRWMRFSHCSDHNEISLFPVLKLVKLVPPFKGQQTLLPRIVHLRALSICQNWPAGPWPDQSVWKWYRLFPSGFAKKNSSPSCILFRIWLIWLDSFD